MRSKTLGAGAGLAVVFLTAQCYACLPRSAVPALAPPGHYPSVTSMEVRALGVLMGGILETKAMNMVSAGFVTGTYLLDGKSLGFDAAGNTAEKDISDLAPSRLPMTRRMPSPLNSVSMESARLQVHGLQMRGGCARTRSASHMILKASPSDEPRTEQHRQVAKTDVNSEPLYPELTKADKLLAVVFGVAAAALKVAWSTTTAGAVVGGSVAMAAGAGAWAVARRDWRMAGRLVTEEEAGYEGSRFVEAGAVRAHYLEAVPAGGGGGRASVVLVHGFGASARSYHACMQALADAAQARVVAVDMPGFGLTSRPNTLRDYDPAAMLDRLSAALHLRAQGPVVVVGHSLGGLAAARHLLSAPEPPDAAVLVAPAIIASAARRKEGEAQQVEARGGSGGKPTGLKWVGAVVGAMMRLSAATLTLGLVSLLRLLTPALSLVLRLAVYTKAFWSAGLAAAYHDRSKLSETTLEGYRRGGWVRGWEAGVLNFIRFRATAGKGPGQLLREAMQGAGEGKRGLVEELSSVEAPLLIVHGEQDQIIPCSNSRSLSCVTESEFVAIDKCGHCPMEEQPERFVQIVADFVSRLPGVQRDDGGGGGGGGGEGDK